MSHKSLYFFFTPAFFHPEDAGRRASDLVACVKLETQLAEMIRGLARSGQITRRIRTIVEGQLYRDPMMINLMKNDPAAIALVDVEDNELEHGVMIELVLDPDPDSGDLKLFFEVGVSRGARSKKIHAGVFCDFSERSDWGSPIDPLVDSTLGGVFVRPDPASDREYKIPVVRVSYSKPHTIKVKARNQEEAESLALGKAGDLVFSESEFEYELGK